MKDPKHKLKRIERAGENYELSRWVPVVKDIAEVGQDFKARFFEREIST